MGIEPVARSKSEFRGSAWLPGSVRISPGIPGITDKRINRPERGKSGQGGKLGRLSIDGYVASNRLLPAGTKRGR